MDQKKIFSQNLQRELSKSIYNQTNLAEKLQTSQSNVSKWINEVQYPRISTIRKIADILEIPIYKLTEPPSSLDQMLTDFNKRDAQSVRKFQVLKSGQYSKDPFLSFGHIVPAYLTNDNDVSAVLLNDDSMNIYFPKNSYVFYTNSVLNNVDNSLDSGDFVVCLLNKSILVREYHNEKSVMLLSRSFTNQYDPIIVDKNDNFQILGKVIWYCASDLIGDE